MFQLNVELTELKPTEIAALCAALNRTTPGVLVQPLWDMLFALVGYDEGLAMVDKILAEIRG